MTDMFRGATLSVSNYDNLLIGWSNLQLQSNISFNGGNSQYSNNAKDARQYILDTFNWTISDGGLTDPISTDIDKSDSTTITTTTTTSNSINTTNPMTNTTTENNASFIFKNKEMLAGLVVISAGGILALIGLDYRRSTNESSYSSNTGKKTNFTLYLKNKFSRKRNSKVNKQKHHPEEAIKMIEEIIDESEK